MARRRAAPTFASYRTTAGASSWPPTPPPHPSQPAPEFPLLAIFAGLIVVAMVPICLVIAVPSIAHAVAALATVSCFAIAVSAMLAV